MKGIGGGSPLSGIVPGIPIPPGSGNGPGAPVLPRWEKESGGNRVSKFQI